MMETYIVINENYRKDYKKFYEGYDFATAEQIARNESKRNKEIMQIMDISDYQGNIRIAMYKDGIRI